MPGLHLSLGIFNRLFSLLEADCQQLDLQLAARETGISGASLQEYAQLLSQFTRLQQEHSEERDKIILLTGFCAITTTEYNSSECSGGSRAISASTLCNGKLMSN